MQANSLEIHFKFHECIRTVCWLLYVISLKHSKYRQIKGQAQIEKHSLLKVKAERATVHIGTQQKMNSSATSPFCLLSSIFSLEHFCHPL